MVFYELLVPSRDRTGPNGFSQERPAGIYAKPTPLIGATYRVPQGTLMHRADRVWLERNGQVTYLKNRTSGSYTEVDMDEFLWIKLKAKML